VIVAHGLDAKQSDQHQLAPIADAIDAASLRQSYPASTVLWPCPTPAGSAVRSSV